MVIQSGLAGKLHIWEQKMLQILPPLVYLDCHMAPTIFIFKLHNTARSSFSSPVDTKVRNVERERFRENDGKWLIFLDITLIRCLSLDPTTFWQHINGMEEGTPVNKSPASIGCWKKNGNCKAYRLFSAKLTKKWSTNKSRSYCHFLKSAS